METPAWQARFRAQIQFVSEPARRARDRGVAVTNPDGVLQLYAWDVRSGTLRQVTQNPQGTFTGSIAPDGRYVYFRTEDTGNEFGHWVRVPFEGGALESLTPDMAPYASYSK